MSNSFYVYKDSNYTLIDKVALGVTMHEAIDETLDYCDLITETTSITFNLWESIKLVIDDYEKKYLIADIQKEYKLDSSYKTILKLIEPTKYLEKILINIALTNKEMSLLEQINRVLLNCELIEVGDTTRFNLSSNLSTFLSGVDGEDFFFEKSTLREALDSMLSIVGARVEVKEIIDINDIEIDYYVIEEQQATPSEIGDVQKKVEASNVEMLATEIEAYAINSFTGDRDFIYHPSPNGWDTFKTLEALLTTNNAVIKTSFPIEEIEEFIVKCDIVIRFWTEGQVSSYDKTFTEIDITRNVVSKEVWDILEEANTSFIDVETTEDLYKQNTIYYTRESSDILGSLQYQRSILGFTASNFQTAFINAVYHGKTTKDWLADNTDYYDYINDLYWATPTWLSGLAPDTTDALFRIKYQPYIDAHAKIGKKNYRDVKSTIINAQNDKIIDLKRFGIMLSENVNRLGNEEITIDTTHDLISSAYAIGEKINDYVVIEKVMSIYNNFIKAQYKLSKNYTMINHKIGIDRKKQIYAIPLENFKVDILYKQIVYFKQTGDASDELLLNEVFKLFTTTTQTPITTSLVRTSITTSGDLTSNTLVSLASQESNGYITPVYEISVVDYHIASSIFFTFKFQDNFSVGMSVTNQVVGGIKTTPNPYVNDDGEYYQLWFRLLADDSNVVRSTAYADIKLLPKADETWYSSAIIPISKVVKREKDRYEHQSITYQLELLSEDDDVIIGDAFAEHCSFINSDKETMSYYESTTDHYQKGDTAPRGAIKTFPSIVVYKNRIMIISATMEDAESWAIVDSESKIIVASNHRKNGSLSYIYARSVYERS